MPITEQDVIDSFKSLGRAVNGAPALVEALRKRFPGRYVEVAQAVESAIASKALIPGSGINSLRLPPPVKEP